MTSTKATLYTAVLLACLLAHTFATSTTTTTTSSTFPKAIIDHFAKREMRYKHYLWHNMRNNWNNYTEAVKQQFRDRQWEPPRPALKYNADGTTSAITDNYSGEDFLYMHSQMIATARSLVANDTKALAWLKGWTSIPAPGDTDYPVPANYTIKGASGTTSSTTTRKTTDFYNKYIRPAELTLTDPVQLRKMTLGQLGSRIEFTIHNYLHMRFSENCTYGFRLTYKGTVPYIDPTWDNAAYNWLGDTYSSHVHPIFWRIHGWVDDRIEDWRKANNLTKITWKGTWTGGPTSTLSSVLVVNTTTTTTKAALRTPLAIGARGDETNDDTSSEPIMDQVMSIMLNAGQEASFADPIELGDWIPAENRFQESDPEPTGGKGRCPLPKSR